MEPGAFVSYRRDDTGWAANAVADALRCRLGPERVFLDNSSIALGVKFAQEIEDAVRRSGVLLALIGARWDTARLQDDEDWVRREILAHDVGTRIVPVLVDRPGLPPGTTLPIDLRFLHELQRDELRQSHPTDVEMLADRVAELLPLNRLATAPRASGVDPTRPALDAFLHHILPPAQQWSGNRDRLLDLALAVLGPDDRLTFLVPARIHDGPRGSATVLVTTNDILVVEVGENFRIRGEIRFPRGRVRRVEVVPTLPLFADAIVHTTAGDEVRLQGLFRDQARQLADHLRA